MCKKHTHLGKALGTRFPNKVLKPAPQPRAEEWCIWHLPPSRSWARSARDPGADGPGGTAQLLRDSVFIAPALVKEIVTGGMSP